MAVSPRFTAIRTLGRPKLYRAVDRPATAPKRKRRRARPLLQKLHRWGGIVTGIALMVIVLSGIGLIWAPEIHEALHGDLYRSTPTDAPIPPERAAAVVRRGLPDFTPADVVMNRGVWEVHDPDYLRQAHVDPGTGRLLGVSSHDAGVMGLLANLHICGLTCEGYPGYAPFLAATVPYLGDDIP
jgi:hypothetical protein